ncbi:MAG: hypothetical protein M1819_002492 [Sarea resinae]|nr:MAG: hypothetical protein M1819_002492 [Sarea resinae]
MVPEYAGPPKRQVGRMRGVSEDFQSSATVSKNFDIRRRDEREVRTFAVYFRKVRLCCTEVRVLSEKRIQHDPIDALRWGWIRDNNETLVEKIVVHLQDVKAKDGDLFSAAGEIWAVCRRKGFPDLSVDIGTTNGWTAVQSYLLEKTIGKANGLAVEVLRRGKSGLGKQSPLAVVVTIKKPSTRNWNPVEAAIVSLLEDGQLDDVAVEFGRGKRMLHIDWDGLNYTGTAALESSQVEGKSVSGSTTQAAEIWRGRCSTGEEMDLIKKRAAYVCIRSQIDKVDEDIALRKESSAGLTSYKAAST